MDVVNREHKVPWFTVVVAGSPVTRSIRSEKKALEQAAEWNRVSPWSVAEVRRTEYAIAL